MNCCTHAAYERITGAKTMVLCVHGIQGSPLQFDWITASLPPDTDYKCILLPGHGGSVRDFSRQGARSWQAYVSSVCREIGNSYERIVYIGHSMGCLLGINAAAAQDAHFNAMLLLACPMKIRPTLKYFADNYRAAVSGESADPYVRALQRANSVEAASPLLYLGCIKPYIGLFRLMAQAGRHAALLQPPATLIHSENDEIVSPKSLVPFSGRPGFRTLIVPGSGHFLYTDAAKAAINSELNALLAGLRQ